VVVLEKKRCSVGGADVCELLFRATADADRSSTYITLGDHYSPPRRTPKGATVSWVTHGHSQRILRAIHVLIHAAVQLAQERAAASPRALMSCATHVKRRAKSPACPWLSFLHSSRTAIYNALFSSRNSSFVLNHTISVVDRLHSLNVGYPV
jgi:hypothetical protein